ncbi:MAG TPA: hypothetical protein VGH37_14950 [Candidatus Acidoferrum sp.]|jgi:hypothetical protein
MIRLPETAYVFLSSGLTMGASGIGITANGNVVRLPSNSPEGYRLVQMAMEMVSVSETVNDANLQSELQKNAAKLMQVGRAMLERTLNALPPEANSQSA